MRRNSLYATAVIAGFGIMALEIVGPRYLYPRFGSTVDVWAAIISTFVIAWSIGSWIGGRLADRVDTNALLGWCLVLAGTLFMLLPAWASPFVNALPDAVHRHRAGALLACLILFLPPFLLLGGLSPMLVRLLFLEEARVAATTGTLYAVSSIGNVLGILVSNYLLMTWFPLNANTIGMGIVLALLGLAHLFIKVEVHRPAVPVLTTSGPA